MAISAVKFIGLTVGSVALGVLSASFVFGQMGPGAGQLTNNGQKGPLGLNFKSIVTEDEMPGPTRHILRRD